MIKFICYALRFVADAEARMIAQESSGEVSNKDDTSSGDDKTDVSDNDNNRPADNQGSSLTEKDMMKDARELFRWTLHMNTRNYGTRRMVA
jgi:hypothetical protein